MQIILSRITTSMKFTRNEELRIQLEASVTEINRLYQEINKQKQINQLNQSNQTKAFKSKSTNSDRTELLHRIVTYGKVIKGLDDQKQELLAKNQYLCDKLQKVSRRVALQNIDNNGRFLKQ